MDPNALMGMIFTLVTIALIGGIVLLYPVARHLGTLLEQKTRANASDGTAGDPANAGVHELIRDLQLEVHRLSERQEFVEKLLAEPARQHPEKLPR